jgi:hypothetical protein
MKAEFVPRERVKASFLEVGGGLEEVGGLEGSRCG